MLKIVHLFESPEHISLVANWIYQEFWTDKEGFSPEVFEELLTNAKTANSIPLSVARASGEREGYAT